MVRTRVLGRIVMMTCLSRSVLVGLVFNVVCGKKITALIKALEYEILVCCGLFEHVYVLE
jgi:hypothetical protein